MRKKVFLILHSHGRIEVPNKVELHDNMNNKGKVTDDKVKMHEIQI